MFKLSKFLINFLLFVFLVSCGLGLQLGKKDSNLDGSQNLGSTSSLLIDKGVLFVGSELGGLGISKDRGETFTTKTTSDGLGSDKIQAIYVDSDGVLYVGTSAGLSISTDGGESYTNKTTIDGLPSDSVLEIKGYGRDVYFSVNTVGKLVKTTDRGTSFTVMGVENGIFSYNVRSIAISSEGNIALGLFGGGVCISTNGGSSFSNYTASSHGLSNNSVYKVYFDSNNKLYVGSLSGLSMITDLEANFINRGTANGMADGHVRDIVVDNAGVIYLSEYNAWTGSLAISTNGGTSFTARDNSDGLTTETSVFTQPTGLALGSSGSLFTSFGWAGSNKELSRASNNGTSFSYMDNSNGLPDEAINEIFSSNYDGKVFVGTKNGFAISSDDGENFLSIKTISDGLPSDSITLIYESNY